MKVERILTLSVYDGGRHKIKGIATPEDRQWARMSFNESLTPLSDMIQAFFRHHLGTKIRVTMEVVEDV